MMEDTELCFPNLNSSCMKFKHSHSVTVFISFILTSVSVVTVILNLLVIISISHFRQLHTPTNLLLLSLAASDFFVGFNVFIEIFIIDGCWYLGDLICVLYCVFGYIITIASVGTIVLISAERYVAICHPLHYHMKVTAKRVKTCVSLCWIWSIFFVGVLLKDNLSEPGRANVCFGECATHKNFIQYAADLTFTFILPVTVMILLYIRVFMVAVSQSRAMRSHIAAVTHQRSGNITTKKSELKAARTLGILVIIFLLCLCPYYCVTSPSSTIVVLYLFYFNSCLNPIIYAFFYPWFRKCIKLIVTLEILKPGSKDVKVM